MGGTDEPSNLIELSVEEHSLAHKKLYEEHGKEEDFIAYCTLSGQIGKDEALTMARSLGGKKKSMSPEGKARMIASKVGKKHSEWHKAMISNGLKNHVRTSEHAKNNRDSRLANGKPWHNEEAKKKISEGMKKAIKKKCPHCDRIMGVSNLAYHIKRKHGETND